MNALHRRMAAFRMLAACGLIAIANASAPACARHSVPKPAPSPELASLDAHIADLKKSREDLLRQQKSLDPKRANEAERARIQAGLEKLSTQLREAEARRDKARAERVPRSTDEPKGPARSEPKGGTARPKKETVPDARSVREWLGAPGVMHPSLRGQLSKLDPESMRTLEKDLPLLTKPQGDLHKGFSPVLSPGIAKPGRPSKPPELRDEMTLVRMPVAQAELGASSPAASSVYYPSAQLRVSRPFYRAGFEAVGMLSRKGVATCSAVLLSGDWLITAAHCFAESPPANGDIGDVSADEFHSPLRSDAAVYRVDKTGTPRILGSNVTSRAVERVVPHPGWLKIGEYDVALVRLKGAASRELELPLLAQDERRIEAEITIAAFGNAGAAGGFLEVGWQRVDFSQAQARRFGWLYGFEASPLASTCLLDSGGPIYLDRQQGYLGERHVLVGVVSGFKTIDRRLVSKVFKRDEACRGGETLNVRVDTREMREWICLTTANHVRGCPAA
jgi:hypothetical protein